MNAHNLMLLYLCSKLIARKLHSMDTNSHQEILGREANVDSYILGKPFILIRHYKFPYLCVYAYTDYSSVLGL